MDLNQTLRSVAQQAYPAWHCSVIVEESGQEEATALLFDIADAPDPRFELRVGPWSVPDGRIDASSLYCFIGAGETLAPHALESFAYDPHLNDRTAVLYSDHDTMERSGRHRHPWFDPDWSPDHLLSRDYVGGVYLARDSAGFRDALGGIPSFDGPAWRYDLLLRLTESAAAVGHIPRVLWSSPATAAATQVSRSAAELEVVTATLGRRGSGATAAVQEVTGIRRITWPIDGHPRVSIVIPTTGRMDLVEPCVTSLTTRTSYPDYELVFLDNSRGANPDGIEFLRSRGHRVIERDEPFNWARLNNVGARAASGELLLFLNDDIEVTDADWLTELVRLAMRPDVGTVGALLTFPDGRIQHAGVVLVGHGGGAMHLMHKADPTQDGYLDLHRVVRETTANTGACLMVSRAHFELIDGFDEDLEVVGNDIDLCLRLNERGYRSLWTPYSTLIHHESLSRMSVSIIPDETRMWRRWSAVLRAGDPNFNPNLAQDRPDCTIDWDSHVAASGARGGPNRWRQPHRLRPCRDGHRRGDTRSGAGDDRRTGALRGHRLRAWQPGSHGGPHVRAHAGGEARVRRRPGLRQRRCAEGGDVILAAQIAAGPVRHRSMGMGDAEFPNVVMLDNPNVPEVAATGQLKPLNGLPGFTTSGYDPGAISECTYQGKQYCYPIGTNTIGIFYNKAMLAAAHLSPPTTWAQLQSDAKALTKGSTYGIAFDATADEQSTWQLEPFFWSNGGSLTDVDTPAFAQSLQLWVNMVKDGSAAKSVLSWGQDPDLTQQFLHQTAAMIEDGPWIFPELNAAGWKYNQTYGIVPIPTRLSGQTVTVPLGGETWNIGNSGSTQQQQAAWEWIEGTQTPSAMTHFTSLMYYLPTKPSITAQYLKGGPEYTVFAKETETARARTQEYGVNYPKVSQAIWTAIQAAITGTMTPSAALQQAQATISSIPKVGGG